jgi:GYF domain 2
MSQSETQTTSYYTRIRGKVHGPFEVEKLKKLYERGQFGRASEISVDRRAWQSASALIDTFEPVDDPEESASASPDLAGKPPKASTSIKEEKEWFYLVNKVRNGPVSLEELVRLVSQGTLKQNDEVWREGMTEFRPVWQCREVCSDGRGEPWYKDRRVVSIAATVGGILFLAVVIPLAWFAFGHLTFGYGSLVRFNNGDLYYSNAFSDEDARRLGNELVKLQWFDGEPRHVQLSKGETNIVVRFVVKKGQDHDDGEVKKYRWLRSQLSQTVFAGAPVQAELCDEHFNTLATIEPFTRKSFDSKE